MFNLTAADPKLSKYASSDECLQAIAFLNGLGCTHVKETKKVSVFSTWLGKDVCIIWEADGIRRDRCVNEERLAIALSPDLTEEKVLSAGIPVVKIAENYCNSNMTCFPRIAHGEKSPICTATKVTVSGAENVCRLIAFYNGL